MQDLPVRVAIEHLFEQDDPKSRYLIDKLNAWINFQTLAANWFADESKIIDLEITLLPESEFLDLELDSAKQWETVSLDYQLVLNVDTTALQARIYGCLTQATIKQLMDTPQAVESHFQDMIKPAVNLVAADFQLQPI